MSHISEEQLILHYYGEGPGQSSGIEQHLSGCAECRTNYNALRLVLNTIDSAPIPERMAGYGGEVWRRIEPKVSRRRGWRAVFHPGRWMLIPITAALMMLAFFAGRLTQPIARPAQTAGQVRERILLVAVGDHLDRSQMILAELSNAPDGKGKVDISEEQKLAGELLEDNRLYRQTARSTGDTAVASVLDDLERTLIEVANSPSEVSKDQFEKLREQIIERGLLFKVRVVGSQVRQREAKSTKL